MPSQPLRHWITRIGTTAIVPSALHDRSHCVARAFTHSCSCDVGHTRLSDNPIASCILSTRHENFSETEYESTPSKKRSRWFRIDVVRGIYAIRGTALESSMIATTALTRFLNGRHAPQAAALSPSCPIAEIWGSGSLTAQTLTDESSPFSTVTGGMSLRWGGARSARGRRTLPVTPSRAFTSTPRRRSRMVELSSTVTGNQSSDLVRPAHQV